MEHWKKLKVSQPNRMFWVNKKTMRMINVEKIGHHWYSDLYSMTKDGYSDKRIDGYTSKSKQTALNFAKARMKMKEVI
jgi:hypothetical protein